MGVGDPPLSLHCCAVCVKEAITLTKDTKSSNTGIETDNADTTARCPLIEQFFNPDASHTDTQSKHEKTNIAQTCAHPLTTTRTHRHVLTIIRLFNISIYVLSYDKRTNFLFELL